MKKSILTLESFAGNDSANTYRTIFKNQHGRHLFLSLKITGNDCTITDCFYTDRNQGRAGAVRYSSKPSLLQSFQFPLDNLPAVIETELDKKFYDVEYIHSDNAGLPLDEYLQAKTDNKYRFLIMLGDGSEYNGLPARLRTRLKNRLHRTIYVELEYYKDGNGVVKQCHYYDRQYRRSGLKITPRQMLSCFFPYSREGIINLLNHELCCDFTHIIATTGIDIESNTTPLCGAI
jgi:hypothetical protein